ncbi:MULTISPECIES: hypothetical protein [unclassified Streptomyces]|uniref:hypothetical protein n=1 Tax=unclassified Streptomyces TaxID=2593676 RepID=UPI00081EA020|nr:MULTISPECIES: hypothetical protein [unclassified Streptomyces]MYR97519.1 hypothetical protein [Streptomyces sp. SID4937]SCE26615.1 hypothetical protein GA0115243_109617 [Streptomyces sp. ScaeMP-e83]
MDQCTAIALLEPPPHVVALFAPVRRLEPGHVLCELGEGHDDDHAAMLWDEGGLPGSAVWARWAGRSVRLASLDWCGGTTPAYGACGLFAGHPSAHGWDVTDPTGQAIAEVLAKKYPHLYPEFTEGDDN